MNKIEFNKLDVRKQIAYINNRLEGDILSVVCEEIGISRSTIGARFKKEGFKYNRHFRQYVNIEEFGNGGDSSEESVKVDDKFLNEVKEFMGEKMTLNQDDFMILQNKYGEIKINHKTQAGSWYSCSKFNYNLDKEVYNKIVKLIRKEVVENEVVPAIEGVTYKVAKEKPKSNKELVEEAVAKEGLVICSCTKDIEKIPKKDLDRVIGVIGYGSSSTVYMNFDDTDYIVEVSQVDNEIDIWLVTRANYEDIYGEIYEEDWEWGLN